MSPLKFLLATLLACAVPVALSAEDAASTVVSARGVSVAGDASTTDSVEAPAAVASGATARALAPTAVGALTSSDDIAALFERVAPAVVGLACTRGETQFYYGTGTIIDPKGLVITSTTVIPRDGENVRVFLRGGKVRSAKLVLVEEPVELALLRLESAEGAAYPYVEIGSAARLRLGDLAFTFGNSFRSIETDDQVSLGKGVVSGFYDLEPTLSQSKYTGPAVETSAPLNSGTDGGPLIDRVGRLVGILSLNYSRSRWLGTAVPVDALRPFLGEHLGVFRDEEDDYPAYFGLSLEERGSEIRVTAVEPGSPAAEAGIRDGDRILLVGEKVLESIPALRQIVRGAGAGRPIPIRLGRGETTVDSSLSPWRRF